MPKKLHDDLLKSAKKAGLTGDKQDAYVYGTLNKIEGNKKKSKPVTRSGRRRRED